MHGISNIKRIFILLISFIPIRFHSSCFRQRIYVWNNQDRGTNFILRMKEQETCLTLHEHDDDDDDDNDNNDEIAEIYYMLILPHN